MVWLGILVLGAGTGPWGLSLRSWGGAFFSKSAIYRARAPVANYHYLARVDLVRDYLCRICLVRDCLVKDWFG